MTAGQNLTSLWKSVIPRTLLPNFSLCGVWLMNSIYSTQTKHLGTLSSNRVREAAMVTSRKNTDCGGLLPINYLDKTLWFWLFWLNKDNLNVKECSSQANKSKVNKNSVTLFHAEAGEGSSWSTSLELQKNPWPSMHAFLFICHSKALYIFLSQHGTTARFFNLQSKNPQVATWIPNKNLPLIYFKPRHLESRQLVHHLH